MSIAEMKERKEKLITAIQDLSEEKLSSVEAFISEINGAEDNTSIEFIYKKAVEQYHTTLLKLAQ